MVNCKCKANIFSLMEQIKLKTGEQTSLGGQMSHKNELKSVSMANGELVARSVAN